MKKILLLILPLLLTVKAYTQEAEKVLLKGEARNKYIYPETPKSTTKAEPAISATLPTPSGSISRSSVSVEAAHQHTESCCPNGQNTQGAPFVCGTVEANDAMRRRNPSWRSEADFEKFIQNKASFVSKIKPAVSRFGEVQARYKIPVIVHVLYFEGQAVGQDHNITAEQVYSQFEVLNEDYRKKYNTRGYNVDKVGADALIEFVPALYDPEGKLLPEPGIQRIKAETITDGQYTIASSNKYMELNWTDWLKSQTYWNPNCYLNVWTVGLANGVLGYATLPDTDLPGIGGLVDATPDEYEGVVIDYRRFGSYEKGPFPGVAQDSKGRAATHEIGHYLGLRHTWGDAPSDLLGQYPEGCEYDDYVDDTPNVKQPMYVNKPLYLCGEREMIENQMDYSNDHVKNVFTEGQVARMHTVMEFSPRRKELKYSTVADPKGETTPIVEFVPSASMLKVYEVFSFETKVHRFPGTYHWEFEGGTPAASSERNPGVYFTTPGTKKITLTVSNSFSSVTLHRYVDVEAFESCEPMFKSTLASLPTISARVGAFSEAFLTGHANVYGIKAIANKLFMTNNERAQAITQVELDFNRFIVEDGFNPDGTFDIQLMDEDADGNPKNILATQKVRVGDAYKAFQLDKPFIVNLDNPICPSTNGYFIVVDLDYQGYITEANARTRKYMFELKASLSPVNFAWESSPTLATIDKPWNQKIFKWKPYTTSDVENGWNVSLLMHLLPKFTPDTTAVQKPEFSIPANVTQNTNFEASVSAKPSNISALQWRIQRANADSIINDKDIISLSYNTAGKYKASLTYLDIANCVQRTTTKDFTVQGIRFKITAPNDKVYCLTSPTTLSIVVDFTSSPNPVFTWSGDGVPVGATGTTLSVQPQKTTTYTATAVDENGISVSSNITLEVIPPKPKAAFEILSPHVTIAADTVEVYTANFINFVVKNLSENAAQFSWSMTRIRGNKIITSASHSTIKNYEESSAILFEGGGLYKFTLIATHTGCSWQNYTRDTAFVYMKVNGQDRFGEVGFTANGNPISVSSSSAYPSLAGAYIAYVNANEDVTLKAESDEIKKISWTNNYSGNTYSTKEVKLTNVRDRQVFSVSVTREREINGQKFLFEESVNVAVLFKEDISNNATVDFYPTFDTVCVDQPVKFVNTSQNAVSFQWEFSGGEYAFDERLIDISALWSPNRVFKAPGEYKAKLTITSVEGVKLDKECTIHVGSPQQVTIQAKAANSYSKVVGNTIYTYDYAETNTDTRLVLTGSGYTGNIRYETYWYNEYSNSWLWLKQTAQNNRLRPFLIFRKSDGEGQKLKVVAESCDKSTVEKIFDVKILPNINYNSYQLKVNENTYSFGPYADLGTNQVEANETLSLQLIATNEAKEYTNVTWYERVDDNTYTLLGNDFQLNVVPTKNTIYTVTFSNTIGQGFSYNIPVQVGIGRENLRLMNYDLELTEDNVIELPLNYSTELVLWIDGVLTPVWNEVGNSTILSTQNAVVLSPRDGVYEVQAKVGERLVKTTVTVKTTKVAVEPPVVVEKEQEAMALYPNPARDVLNIDSPYKGIAYVVDNVGRIVKRFDLQEGHSTLSVNNLSSGVYKLVVQRSKGEKIISRSFIIAR